VLPSGKLFPPSSAPLVASTKSEGTSPAPITNVVGKASFEKIHRLFEDSETNVLLLKFSFLRSLLDWATVHVPNFPSRNLIDLICYLNCCSSYIFGSLASLVYSSCRRNFHFLIKVLLFIKIKIKKANWCCQCKKNEETINHFLIH
jgi:hypothetical protein